MSMQNLLGALEIIKRNPAKADFVGPRPEKIVAAAEERLGLKFPQTYRHFLLSLGAGNFGSEEFYGVIHENFENASVPNGIWCTIDLRKTGLPSHLVVVSDTGDGGFYCLDTSKQGEPPVIIYEPGMEVPTDSCEIVAEDFGDYLLNGVNRQLK